MIPADLREVAQWLVSGADKIPISPKTGRYADIRDRSLYVDYETATAYALTIQGDIGFALTAEDPFVVIDLDNPDTEEQAARHTKIFEAFDTYAELSRSGKGVHIWCRGALPRGVRRDKVEIYPQERYMICTGAVLKDRPVVDCQPLLDLLFQEMDRGGYDQVELEDHDEILDDMEIVEMAENAVNGEKYIRLVRGQWEDEYPSQSEADFALMDMLCFYTRSNEQAKRLFRYSALGKREKAQREKYLDYMIRKIRAEEVPDIDFSGLLPTNGNGRPVMTSDDVREKGYLEPLPPRQPETPPPVTPTVPKKSPKAKDKTDDFTVPPGFVGQLAEYIYSSSTRPVEEIAAASAIGLCAGIVGRQFNISGTGLNQYLIVLAKTGVGKEDGTRGIERLLKSVRAEIPSVDQFLGPGTFASGQAIIRTLDERPCFVSILGEFGLTLQDLSDQNANSLSRVMRRVLLDLYTKSGRSSVLYPSAYSDKEKNTKTLFSPAMTILGESTPESFYEGLSLNHIADGLIPRFLIIEYTGDRPSRNPYAYQPPAKELVDRLAALAEVALRMQANQAWEDVTLSEEAQGVLDSFDEVCDDHIRSGANEGIRQLWNRAHLKALRLAGLLAVADRPHGPVVSGIEAEWAVGVVERDVQLMTSRFARGDIGVGDSKQDSDLGRIIADFLKRPAKELESYGVTPQMKAARVVPAVYLQRRTSALSSFRKDKRGARIALREAISQLIEAGGLEVVNKQQAAKLFDTKGAVFHVLKHAIFEEQ